MKNLGTINQDESKIIEKKMQRKNALVELFYTLDMQQEQHKELYEKIISDISLVNKEIVDWWTEIAERYNWSYSLTDKWSVNFITGQVTLVT